MFFLEAMISERAKNLSYRDYEGKDSSESRLATVRLRWPWSRRGFTGLINDLSPLSSTAGTETVSFGYGVQFYTNLPISTDS